MGIDMGMGTMGFGLLMMFFGLLVLAGIVALIVWAVMHVAGGSGSGVGRGRAVGARQILDERYARGEIQADEYQRIKRELS